MTENDQPVQITSEIGPWAMVPTWVLGKGLSGGELATYVALRSFADRAGDARPYTRTIAERANVSQRTAERAIDRLRELGMIITQRKHRPDGSIAGLSFHLVDRDPGSYGARAVSVPPVTGDGTPPDTGDGTLPTPVTEQEHTNEHTILNTEEKGVPTPRIVPGVLRRGPSDEELRSDEAVLTNGSKGAAVLARQIQGGRPGQVALSTGKLIELVRPPLDNGAPPWAVRRAVAQLIDAGADLAPWTLQPVLASIVRESRRTGRQVTL